MAEVPALVRPGAATGADRPLLTYYDDATGERTELSAVELGGWAARSAGLLHEGCGLGAGSRAAVLLPPHWLTAAALLGAWSIGVEVSFRLWATAGLRQADDAVAFDAVFAGAARIGSWLEDIPAAAHRFAFGVAEDRPAPEGYRDFLAEVRGYPANLPAYARVRGTDAASTDGTSYGQWGAVAQGIAERLGLRAGDRLLADAAEREHPVQWLLAPLSAGASVVLVANADPALTEARIAREGVTRVL